MKTNWNELIPNLNWIEGIGFCKQADRKSPQYIDEEGNLKNVEILREWDYIKDGKYYKNSGEITFDGASDEDWYASSYNSSLPTHVVFIFYFEENCPYSEHNNAICSVICNNFKPLMVAQTAQSSKITTKGVSVYNDGHELRFVIEKSELTTPDLAGFKAWLQDNPTTAVYLLHEPKVYDLVSPINLSSYEDKTVVECNSGTISPTMRFKMTSYITELIKSNRDRIDELEDLHLSYLATLLENETRITLLELGLPQSDNIVDDSGMDIIE